MELGITEKQTWHLLWWFLHSPVVLEFGHLFLDALQAVGEAVVCEDRDFLLYPLQQAGHQCLVVILHLLQLHQLTNNLFNGTNS